MSVPGRAPPPRSRPHRRGAGRDRGRSSAGRRTTSSWPCSASCGASTARTRAAGPLLATLPDRRRRRRRRARRECRRPADRGRAGRRLQDRVAQPSRAPWSRTRGRPPASAGSCATSSRWVPGRSRSSTPSASAIRPTRGRATWSTGSSPGSAATATASACRPSAASSSSTRRTRATRSSTSWPSGSSARTGSCGPPRRARATSSSSTAVPPGATGSGAPRSSPARRSATRIRPSARPSRSGDPFAEKLLIEATLEIVERGLAEGVQDLGAAGITCGVCETADRAGTGHRRRPRRHPAPRAGDGALRGDDQRVAGADDRDRAPRPASPRSRRSATRWGLGCAVIGRVTDDGAIAVVEGGLDGDGRPLTGSRVIARVPARALASEAIVFDRLAAPPPRRRAAPAPGLPLEPAELLPERGMDPGAVLIGLIGSPNLASRRWVYEQYDQHVQTNTVAGPGSRGRRSCGSRGPDGHSSPRLTATRRSRPSTRTSARRSRSPRRRATSASPGPARWASRTASTSATRPGRRRSGSCGRPSADSATPAGRSAIPVTGGNVSLYNESPGRAIAPTPEIGVVGLADDVESLVGPPLRSDGEVVAARGDDRPGPRRLGVRGAGRRRRRRPADPRPGARGRRPGVRAGGDRGRASSRRPRTWRAAGWPSPSPR